MNPVLSFFALVVLLGLIQVEGHGLLWDPPNRSSLWRIVPGLPENDNDNQNFCGGRTTQWEVNGGKCGACGDNWADPVPRANENGGLYGNGVIGQTYKAGTNIEVKVNLTASHKGYFEFALCDSGDKPETEECFEQHQLIQVDGTYRYYITPERENIVDQYIYLQLPKGFKCDRCALRWHYWTSNSVGLCDDGSIQLGCGAMEVFRSQVMQLASDALIVSPLSCARIFAANKMMDASCMETMLTEHGVSDFCERVESGVGGVTAHDPQTA